MSVNVNYWGDTRITVDPVGSSQNNYQYYHNLDIQIGDFYPDITASSASYTIYKGACSTLASTDVPNIFYYGIDASFSWCAMDAYAPQNTAHFANRVISSSTYVNPCEIDFSVNQNRLVPVGFGCHNLANIAADCNIQWIGSSASNIPDTYLPWAGDGLTFNPTIRTNYNIPYIGATGSGIQPVLKSSFKNFILSPILTVAKFKTGKTIADLQSLTTNNYASEVNDIIEGVTNMDLGYYLNTSTSINYTTHPIVLKVSVMSTPLQIDTNNTIITSGASYSGTGLPNVFTLWRVPARFTYHSIYQAGAADRTAEFDPTFVKVKKEAAGTWYITTYNNGTQGSTIGTMTTTNLQPIMGATTALNYNCSTLSPYTYYFTLYARGNDKWHIQPLQTSSSDTSSMYRLVYTHVGTDFNDADEFKEYIRKAIAYYGMYFSDGTSFTNEPLTSNNIMLGIIDSNGITHGEYSVGPDNANQMQADWNDPIEDTPYNPGSDDPWTDEDTNTYIDSMTGKESYSIAGFTRIYALDITQMRGLRQSLNSIPKFFDTSGRTIDDYQLFLSHRFLNTNPIDNILSLKWYPILFTGAVEDVRISNCTMLYDLNEEESTVNPAVNGYRITATQQTIYLGYFDLRSHHNSFLDYEPYTTAECYLPFAAGVQMDINVILNHQIYVSYKVDLKTGAFTAYLSLDSYTGTIITTSHGNIAVDLPVSGIQTANYQNAVYQGLTNLKAAQINIGMSAAQAAVGIGAALATGGAGAAALLPAVGNLVNSQNQLQQARYNIDAQQVPYKTVGSNTSGDGILMYLYPALIMSKPQYMEGYNPITYGHTTGFACVINAELSQVTGYTVCSNADLSGITATDAEIQKINQMLQSGVYL